MDRRWTGYLAPFGFEKQLEKELLNIAARYGRLFLAEGAPQTVRWAQNIWHEPQLIDYRSVGEAAEKLRALQGLWAYLPYACVRRGELIAKKLPYFMPKPFSFMAPLPKAFLGSWTLLNEKTLLCAPKCSSSFAHGEVRFLETKEPPSRAYLKLWEFFMRIGKWPGKGDECLEVGASPGSWTWVLQSLGANTIAIDRAPLAPEIAEKPCVTFFKRDAFSIRPSDFPNTQWIFSDLVCYPRKLLAWLRPWLSRDVHLVCTLKFQGKEDYGVLEEFSNIEGSGLIHLFHNKHELTWYRLIRDSRLNFQ